MSSPEERKGAERQNHDILWSSAVVLVVGLPGQLSFLVGGGIGMEGRWGRIMKALKHNVSVSWNIKETLIYHKRYNLSMDLIN